MVHRPTHSAKPKTKTKGSDLSFMPSPASRPADSRFDLPVWFISRNEDLVRVLDIERRQIRQQVMFVRHCQVDAVQFGHGLQGGLGHLEERSLNGRTVAC